MNLLLVAQRRLIDVECNAVNSVAVSPDRETLAVGKGWDTYPSVDLLDLGSGANLATLGGHSRSVEAVAFSPDGKLVASGDAGGLVKLWSVRTHQEAMSFSGHSDAITSLVFHNESETLISSSYDGTIRLWGITSDADPISISAHEEPIRALALSLDGNVLASASHDKTIKLWDMRNRIEIRTLRSHSEEVLALAFDPTGALLCSGGADTSIRLWDVLSGREIAFNNTQIDAVVAVAYCPLGGAFAVGHFRDDAPIRLYHARTAQLLQTLEGFTDEVNSIAFDAPGRKLVCGGGGRCGGTIEIWQVENNDNPISA